MHTDEIINVPAIGMSFVSCVPSHHVGNPSQYYLNALFFNDVINTSILKCSQDSSSLA